MSSEEDPSDYTYESDSSDASGRFETKDTVMDVLPPGGSPPLLRQQSLELETITDAYNDMKQMIQSTSSIFGVADMTAFALLDKFKWDQQKLASEMADNQEKVLQRFELEAGGDTPPKRKAEADSDMEGMCPVCWDDVEGEEKSFSLLCGHEACLKCWRNAAITRMYNSELYMHCIGECNYPITIAQVRELVDSKEFSKFRELLLNRYVSGNPFLRWCPNPKCTKILHARRAMPGSVRCQCGEVFCGSCSQEPHDPLPCDLYLAWVKELGSGGESRAKEWIMKNTKPCPKCNTNIEKNGGCNHMHCTKCNLDFCWICLQKWEAHNCAGTARAPHNVSYSQERLDRLLKCQAAFKGQDDSSEFEDKMREEIPNTAAEVAKRKPSAPPSWVHDVEFSLRKALDVLSDCRKTLKFCYPLGFYLWDRDKPEEAETLSCLQGLLTEVTENLAQQLEKTPETIDLAVLTSLRMAAEAQLKRLAEGTELGFSFYRGWKEQAPIDIHATPTAPVSAASRGKAKGRGGVTRGKPRAAITSKGRSTGPREGGGGGTSRGGRSRGRGRKLFRK